MVTSVVFDSDAADVMRVARDLAVERGETKISPHILLVALTTAGGATVPSVLAGLGFTCNAARSWLTNRIGPLAERAPFDDAAPYFLRTSAILDMAEREATESGVGAVGPRELVLGILRESDSDAGVAGATLLDYGATYERLKLALP